MSTSSQSTGATGAVTNTTNITSTQGANGAPGGTSMTTSPPGVNVGYTAGPRNWMDDAIDSAIKNFYRG
jgi:hypothetical protein